MTKKNDFGGLDHHARSVEAAREAGGTVDVIDDPAIRAEETSIREADAALLTAEDKSPRSQSEKFIEKARELGLDDVDTSAADALMGRLANTPPEPKPAAKKPAPKEG